jgi:hypothetical protein
MLAKLQGRRFMRLSWLGIHKIVSRAGMITVHQNVPNFARIAWHALHESG